MKVYILFRREKWDKDSEVEFIGVYLNKQVSGDAAAYLTENELNFYRQPFWEYWTEERKVNTDEVYSPPRT